MIPFDYHVFISLIDIFQTGFLALPFGYKWTKYSRMKEVKFLEDSL